MTPTTEKPDLAGLIGDIAAQVLSSRSRMQRSELVERVLEAVVLRVLEDDPRFHGSARGLYWELVSRRERNELERRAVEERLAEAAREAAPQQYERYLEQARALGLTEPRSDVIGRYEPVGEPEPPLDDEEAAA